MSRVWRKSKFLEHSIDRCAAARWCLGARALSVDSRHLPHHLRRLPRRNPILWLVYLWLMVYSIVQSQHPRWHISTCSLQRPSLQLASLIASLNKIFLDSNLLESTQINICEIQVTTYASCSCTPKHLVRGDYLQCTIARACSNQQVCVPTSGQLRDLPISLDVQDTNVAGECPICKGQTLSNSLD